MKTLTQPDPVELAGRIIRRCLDLGFMNAGVCEARPSDREAELRAWLSAGKHGDMAYLAEHAETRLDPRRVMPDARSIIVVADRYAPRGHRDEQPAGEPVTSDEGEPLGLVARYARGRDYHPIIKRRLHTLADALRLEIPGSEFRTVVDTAPVLEREHAARAGIGWVGKHTLVLHPGHGSWFVLGCILTNLELRPPEPVAFADHCGTCTRCIDACPTQAIAASPGVGGARSIDARRCISYLTIEHRGVIAPELHAGIGQRVFGCDVCQEVCPHNLTSADEPEDHVGDEYAPRLPLARGWLLQEMLNWTDQDRWLGLSALKRATLEMFKRNAIIAAGNALHAGDHPSLLARLRELAVDDAEPELVRETARQVLGAFAAGS